MCLPGSVTLWNAVSESRFGITFVIITSWDLFCVSKSNNHAQCSLVDWQMHPEPFALLCFFSVGSDSRDQSCVFLFQIIPVHVGDRTHEFIVRWVPSKSGNLSIFQPVCLNSNSRNLPLSSLKWEWCLLSVIHCYLLQRCPGSVFLAYRFWIGRGLRSYGG